MPPSRSEVLGRNRQKWLQSVHTVQTALTTEGDLSGMLLAAATEFHAAAGAQVTGLYRSAPVSEVLELAASCGPSLRGERGTDSGLGYARLTIRRAPLLYIRDLSRSEPVQGRERLVELDLRSCLGLPLIAHGQILGAIVSFARRAIPADAEAAELYETLAGQAALALEQARLRDAAGKESGTAREPVPGAKPNGALNQSQLPILRMLVEGKSNRQIALAVGLSENTIKFHIREIFRKLHAANRVEAAVAAVRRGIL